MTRPLLEALYEAIDETWRSTDSLQMRMEAVGFKSKSNLRAALVVLEGEGLIESKTEFSNRRTYRVWRRKNA